MPSKFSDSLHLHRQYCIDIYIYMCVYLCVCKTLGKTSEIPSPLDQFNGLSTNRTGHPNAEASLDVSSPCEHSMWAVDQDTFQVQINCLTSRNFCILCICQFPDFHQTCLSSGLFQQFGFTHLPKWCLRSQLSWQNSASQNKNETKKNRGCLF